MGSAVVTGQVFFVECRETRRPGMWRLSFDMTDYTGSVRINQFMEADKAAKVMLDRVDRNVGLIAFPWPMRFGVWLMSALPWRVSEFISGILPEKTSTGRCKGSESQKIAF